MNKYENEIYQKGNKLIAGTDEVGRGCIAGPIVCAAVILPKNYQNDAIKDSKLLSAKQREKISKQIIDDCIAYAIVEIDANTVDLLNPKQASRMGMKECINKLNKNPDYVLSDFETLDISIPNIAIVHGDKLSISIAAASIIAKVYRDELMVKYHNDVNQHYHFNENKGYLTKKHLQALKQYGPIKNFHRFSYKPIKG